MPVTQQEYDSAEAIQDNFADGPDPSETQASQPATRDASLDTESSPAHAPDDYDFDDPAGEIAPPAAKEPAPKVGDEPATSGGVDDGESFPPELLAMVGITDAQAKVSFKDRDGLEKYVVDNLMQMGIADLRQRQQQHLQQGQSPPPSTDAGQQQAPPAQPATPPTQEEIDEYLRLKLELPSEFADIEDNQLLFDALSQQVGKFYAPHLKKLEENYQRQQQILNYFVEREQAEQVRKTDEDFDNFIESLPAEWHDLLGSTRPEVGTPEHKARAQLFHAAQVLDAGAKKFGQQIPLERLLEMGLRTAFPEKHDTVIKSAITAQRKGRPRIARPTNRTGSPLSADESAEQAVRQFIRDRGGLRPENDGFGPGEF